MRKGLFIMPAKLAKIRETAKDGSPQVAGGGITYAVRFAK